MSITFKRFLTESVTSHTKLAKKLGIKPNELANMTDKEIHYLLKDVGHHDFEADSDFNSTQLKKGIKIEKEHTKSTMVAKLIAKDHLKEIPDYYTRLDKMEKEAGIND